AASVLSFAPALSGCMTQLAPLYDQSISNELAAVNLDIHALFVAVGTDAPLATYPSRKPQYDHLVAELAAAELQIRARPIPKADSMSKAAKALDRMHVRSVAVDPGFSVYPSARALADLEHSV